MGYGKFISLIFFIVVVSLLILYWFVPFSTTEFFTASQGANFHAGIASSAKQFYENMRFPSPKISYRIEGCTLQKQADMKEAFALLSEKTLLEFSPVDANEEITVTCDSQTKIEDGLFIAGEGGPTNITQAGEFNVITHGSILLLRDSTCPTPNIALHELLHVLGFDHSSNPHDLMYGVSRCDQEINPLLIDTLNELYSIPPYADLVFENVEARMQGKYLHVNMSVRNNGFMRSSPATITIYADDKAVKDVTLDSLDIGHGRYLSLTNIWISQLSVDTVSLVITSQDNELKKENNRVVLSVKK